MSEYRPGGFQILPPVIKNLIIINVLVFAATYVLQQANVVNLNYYLALFHWKSVYFKPWQFITYLFMHGGISHIFFNMFALWMFGSVIENMMGSKRFLIFYIVCGIGAALCHLAIFSIEMKPIVEAFKNLPLSDQQGLIYDPRFKLNIPTVGASGSIYGVLFAFGYLLPNATVYLVIVPMKAKFLVIIYAAIELFEGFQNNPGDSVAHFAHLGGMLFAFLLLKIWRMNSRRSLY
jgi:membrane associated rhomboid family serine protease